MIVLWNNDDMFCRPNIVLPSVYSKALSFYETVCLIAQRVERVYALVEEYEQNYKNYTDEQIALLKIEINNLLNETIESLNNQYQGFTNIVNSQLNRFESLINQLSTKIDANYASMESYVNLRIAQNNDYIFDKIKNEELDIKVTNYFTGESVTVQNMFDYLAKFHLENAITIDELIAKNKTVQQLIDLNITYTQIAVDGKSVIV